MWQTYRILAREVFSTATYVADKYHYAGQVLWAFEAVRQEVHIDFYDSRRKYFKRSKTLLIKHYRNPNDDQKQLLNVMLYTSEKLLNVFALMQSKKQLKGFFSKSF